MSAALRTKLISPEPPPEASRAVIECDQTAEHVLGVNGISAFVLPFATAMAFTTTPVSIAERGRHRA